MQIIKKSVFIFLFAIVTIFCLSKTEVLASPQITVNNTSQGYYFRTAAYGNNIYIAVGGGGYIERSTDGLHWSRIIDSTIASHNLTGSAYGDNTFVVSGENGEIFTSPDGITWTLRSSGVSSYLGKIIYTGSSFYIVGYDGIVLTSPDGTSWTKIDIGASGKYLSSIAYGNNTLVIGDATSYPIEGGDIYYSSNGTTWNSAKLSSYYTNDGINFIKYMNGKFYASNSDAALYTSSDGQTWTSVGAPFRVEKSIDGCYQIFAALWDGTNYYYFGQANGVYGAVIKSLTGTSDFNLSTTISTMVTSDSLYVNGVYIQVCGNGLLVSTDGSNWTCPVGFGNFSSFVYDGSKYLAAGSVDSDGAIYSSTDFNTWSLISRDEPMKNVYLSSIAYGLDKYIAVGYLNSDGSSKAYTSSDGETWAPMDTTGYGGLMSITYGNGSFVAVSGSGDLITSTNGVNWTNHYNDGSGTISFNSVAFINNKFIACGNGGVIYYSDNGTDWTNASYSDTTVSLYGVAYGGGKYLFVGGDSNWKAFTMSSSDLKTYNLPSHQVSGLSALMGITYGDGTFMAITNDSNSPSDGYITTSTDGDSWTNIDCNNTSYLANINYINNKFRIGGAYNLAMSVGSAPKSTIATITSSDYTVSTGGTASETITNVPYGRTQAAFLAALAKGQANQTWDLAGLSDPVVSDDKIVVTAQDGTTKVTYTVTVNPDTRSSARAITSFGIGSGTGTIDETDHTIAITVPYGTVVTSLTPTIGVSDKAAVSPLSGATEDFTNPVTYTVTAENGATQNYVVTVTVGPAPKSSIATITSSDYTVSAGGTASETITNVPYGRTQAAFLAAITQGESHESYDVSGLHDPVLSGDKLIVTAEDGTTKVTYMVTVNPDTRSSAKAMTSFSIGSETGTIDETNHTIAITVPYGTSVTSLTPTIGVSDKAVVSPLSGATKDFTNPVTYTVTAENGTTQNYVVTVIVGPAPKSTIATITSSDYMVSAGGAASETITNVPYGRTQAAFLAALAKGQANQTWDVTGLSDPVVSGDKIVVTAEDGTTKATYTVTVNPPAVQHAFTVQASAAKLSTVAGEADRITLTVNNSDGSKDSSFTGSKTVIVLGPMIAPNGSIGTFNGGAVTGGGISIDFSDGVAQADIVLYSTTQQTIEFRVDGVNTPETNAVTITPVPAAVKQIEIIQNIASPSANGGQFASQPALILIDAYGNVCSNDNTTVVTASKADSGNWMLTGTTTAQAIQGIVAFVDLGAGSTAAVTGAAISFSVTTGSGIAAVSSAKVNIPAPPSVVQPAYTAIAGLLGSAAPTAGNGTEVDFEVKKSDGSRDTSFSKTVNVTISGYKAAPDGSYGSFNGVKLTQQSQSVPVNFVSGYAQKGLPVVLNSTTSQAIKFSIDGVASPETNTVAITPAPAAVNKIEIMQNIASPSVNGGQFALQPELVLKDVYGNVCTNDSTTTVTAVKADGGAWILTGTTTVNADNGIVVFSDLGASSSGAVSGAQVLFTASVTGASVATSAAVNIPATVPTVRSAYTAAAFADEQVPTVGVNDGIKIEVRDSNGNRDTSFTGMKQVTISGYTAAPDGSYGSFNGTKLTAAPCTVSMDFENGVTNEGLAVVLNSTTSQAIKFSVAGVNTSETNAVTITPVPAAVNKIGITQNIASPSVNGGQFALQPELVLKDAYGNVCTNDSTTSVTAVKADGGAWTLTGTTAAKANHGTVTFIDLGAVSAAAVTGAQLSFSATGVTTGSGITAASSSAVNIPAPPSPVYSSDAKLSSLIISSGILNPGFNSDITNYDVVVSHDTDRITLIPEADESHASVSINGTFVSSGTTSSAITLNIGANSINITVKAQDGTIKTYTVNTVRSALLTKPSLTEDITTITGGSVSITIGNWGDASVKKYSMDNGITWFDYTAPVKVNFNGTILAKGRDTIGNWSDAGSLTINNIDDSVPKLRMVNIISNNSNSNAAKSNDTIVLKFTSTAELQGSPVVTIAGHSVSAVYLGSNTYRTLYTMTSDDAEGTVPFSIDFKGQNGVSGDTVSSTTDNSRVNFYRTVPVISTPSVSLNTGNKTAVVRFTKTGSSGAIFTEEWLPGKDTVGDFLILSNEVTNDSFTVSENGSYTIYVSDQAGNSSISTVSVSGIVKELSLTVDSPDNDVKLDANGEFTMTGTITDENHGSVTVKAPILGISKTAVVDSSKSSTFSLTWKAGEIADGQFINLNITAVSQDGAKASAIWPHSLTVMKTPPPDPNLLMTTTSNGAVYNYDTAGWTSSTVSFQLIDTPQTTLTSCRYSNDGGLTWRDGNSGVISSEGTFVIVYNLEDNNGNKTQQQAEVRIDRTPPTGTFKIIR